MPQREERLWRNVKTKAKLEVWTAPVRCYWRVYSSNGHAVCTGEGRGTPSKAEESAFNAIRLMGGNKKDWVKIDG